MNPMVRDRRARYERSMTDHPIQFRVVTRRGSEVLVLISALCLAANASTLPTLIRQRVPVHRTMRYACGSERSRLSPHFSAALYWLTTLTRLLLERL